MKHARSRTPAIAGHERLSHPLWCLLLIFAIVTGCEGKPGIGSGAGQPPNTPKSDLQSPPNDDPDNPLLPLRSSPPSAALAAADTRRKELDSVPADRVGTSLGIQVLVDYEVMLEEARTIMSSGGTPEKMYPQIVEIKRRYTQVFIDHGKERESNGKTHFRDTDKYVNRHKELLPLAKSQWIELEIEKYRTTHLRLAEELNFLPYLINYSNFELFKRFDPDRARSLGIQ